MSIVEVEVVFLDMGCMVVGFVDIGSLVVVVVDCMVDIYCLEVVGSLGVDIG